MHHSSYPSSGHRLFQLAVGVILPLLFASSASAAPFGYMDSVTVFGDINLNLYNLMMWISIAILVVVEAALVYAIFKFRKRAGENRAPESWSHNTTLEIVWTVIPFILLIIICVPTFQGLLYMVNIPKKPDLVLEVVGRQYFWEYRFPELNATFNSRTRLGDVIAIKKGTPEWDDIALHLPINQKILVKFTAADVIHSWWVPAFGMQQMTTPGNLVQFPLEIKEEGRWQGACAYLCGPLHGAMDIKVMGVNRPAFDAWIASHQAQGEIAPFESVGKIGAVYQKPKASEHSEGDSHGAVAATHSEAKVAVSPAENTAEAPAEDLAALAKDGAALYAARCAGCHQPTGDGLPGLFPPLAGAEQVNGPDEALVDILLKGLNGPITVKGGQYNGQMPAFADLSDKEIASVLNHLRSSWGNNGKLISPAQVKARR